MEKNFTITCLSYNERERKGKERKGKERPGQENSINTTKQERIIARSAGTRFLKVMVSSTVVVAGQVSLSQSVKAALFIFPIILLE